MNTICKSIFLLSILFPSVSFAERFESNPYVIGSDINSYMGRTVNVDNNMVEGKKNPDAKKIDTVFDVYEPKKTDNKNDNDSLWDVHDGNKKIVKNGKEDNVNSSSKNEFISSNQKSEDNKSVAVKEDRNSKEADKNKKTTGGATPVKSTSEDIIINKQSIVSNKNGIASNAARITNVEQSVIGLDNRMQALDRRVDDVQDEARAGIANALAIGSLRFDSTPGKVSIAGGFGGFKGSNAFAAGVGYTSEESVWRANAGVARNLVSGDMAWNAGLSFTLN